MWSRTGWILIAVLLATSGATAQQDAPRDLVLEGATLIDGTGKPPVTDAVVVVEGARIKAVGRRGQVRIPANANVIRLAGRTILPGLIDGHVHIQEWQLPLFLHAGVTTIADMNNDLNWIIAQRDGQRRGLIKGPRLFVSGPTLWGNMHPQTSRTFNSLAVDTADQARARVRALAAAGVDIIHVDDGISDDALRAVIEETGRAGLPATGHTQNILKAAEMGFKFEEHLDTFARGVLGPRYTVPQRLWPPQAGFIPPPPGAPESLVDPKEFPPAIDLMVKQGVFVNPTIVVSFYGCTPRWHELAAATDQLLKTPGIELAPADARQAWPTPPGRCRAGYDNMAEFLREYSAAGGKIIMGTDTSGSPNLHIIPGQAVHDEMQMLVDAGVPAMNVIEGATLWNAQMLKQDKDIGSVEPGKLADFTVIEGNPLTNMAATRNIRMVIQNGQVIDTKLDAGWVNPIPQPFTGDYRQSPVQISNLAPGMAPQNGQTLTLEIQGSGFTPGSVARFDNADLSTQFVSATRLTAILDARLLQRHSGSYPLYVVNPGFHGTVSAPAYFLVNFKD